MNQNLVQRETTLIDNVFEIKKNISNTNKNDVSNLIKKTQKFYFILINIYIAIFFIQLFMPVISVSNIFSSIIFSKGKNLFMFVSPTNLPFWIYFQLVKLGISCLFFLLASSYILITFFKLKKINKILNEANVNSTFEKYLTLFTKNKFLNSKKYMFQKKATLLSLVLILFFGLSYPIIHKIAQIDKNL